MVLCVGVLVCWYVGVLVCRCDEDVCVVLVCVGVLMC